MSENNKTFRKNIFFAILVISITFFTTLIFLEGGLRLYFPNRTMGSLIEKDSELGYRFIPNAQTRYMDKERNVSIRINNAHLRQDEPVSETKGDKEKRVLVVGDSFVFGWGVEFEESFFYHWSQKAKLELPQLNLAFMNGGHGGWGTAQMVRFIEKYGLALKPDLIVLVMGHNDIEDNERNQGVYAYTSEGAKVTATQAKWDPDRSAIANLFPFYDWLRFNSYTVQILRGPVLAAFGGFDAWLRSLFTKNMKNSSTPSVSTSTSDEGSTVQFTQSLFIYLSKLTSSRKIPLLITTCGTGSKRTTSFFTTHANWFRKAGIDYFDITKEFQPLTEKNYNRYYFSDGHLTTDGNRLLADNTWPYLRDWLKNSLHESVK